jgi:hypothetical protein
VAQALLPAAPLGCGGDGVNHGEPSLEVNDESRPIRGLQLQPAPSFPILLKKVVYDGTHTAD